MPAIAKYKFLIIGALGLVILIALSGCSEPSVPDENDAIEDPVEPEEVEPPIEFAAVNESGLTEEDLDTAFDMCRSLLEEYYFERADPSVIDLTRYITDPNLLKYSEVKLKSETHDLDVVSVTVKVMDSRQEDDSYLLSLSAKVTRVDPIVKTRFFRF